MTATMTLPVGEMVLRGRTAEALMRPNPVSILESATIREAIAFLVDRNISGAPVIDEAGRPVGVLTQSDVLVHDREEVDRIVPREYESGAPLPRELWDSFQIERVDTTPVRDLMTPAVFSVTLDTPAWEVVEHLRDLNIHRLFVVDDDGVMVGVISAMDVVRRLVLNS